MMQANELRIGNWVLDDEGKVVIIHRIESQLFNDWNGSGDELIQFKISNEYSGFWQCPLSSCKGIPLTEEILLKCGTDKVYWIEIKVGRKKIIFNCSTKIVATGLRSGWYCKKYRHIKNLHQLQNLVHSLSDKELDIQL